MREMAMNAMVQDWVDVGAAADIPFRAARVVTSPIGDIAVFKAADGHIFALRDKCPHKGGPLSQGIVHGHGVTCPLHNWVIDLATGAAMGADHGCTPKIPLKVEEGRVLLCATAIAALVD
jgi:nitrite reductase (NADH) small subunit